MKTWLRHAIGYLVGFAAFVLLVPWGLNKLSVLYDSLVHLPVLGALWLRVLVSAPFFAVGIIFAAWSNVSLLDVGKGGPLDAFGVAVSPRTKRLVTVGPYRYTRNPMILGAFMLYFGISIFLDSAFCFATVLVFLLLAVIYLKATEEKRLLSEFGDEYERYRKTVPMIFPLKFRTRLRG